MPAKIVPTIRFQQWLPEWDTYEYGTEAPRRKPEPYLYLFAMKAKELRKLCDVYRRINEGVGTEGIQRGRDDNRTARIQQYVQFGYPFGDLQEPLRTSDTENLRKPGWLPTAIVVNIMPVGEERRGRKVRAEDVVNIDERDGVFSLVAPDMNGFDPEISLAPLEVIDGQHRLWAFEEGLSDWVIPDDFEVPVVAFNHLDLAWQAYLFWSINVSPKRINPSHAFDLYPLLRNQDWLERAGALTVYREARAQEVTQAINLYGESPWRGRVNMLGERGAGSVSQAAWIRALMATFLANGKALARRGLFSSATPTSDEPLDWTLSQQAAFIITIWEAVQDALEAEGVHAWIRALGGAEQALTDKASLLSQDMGVRALLGAANELFYRQSENWRLREWRNVDTSTGTISDGDVEAAITALKATVIYSYIQEFASEAIRFDWRSFDGPDLMPEQRQVKRTYRGSGGYVALRTDLLQVMSDGPGPVSKTAKVLLEEAEASS